MGICSGCCFGEPAGGCGVAWCFASALYRSATYDSSQVQDVGSRLVGQGRCRVRRSRTSLGLSSVIAGTKATRERTFSKLNARKERTSVVAISLEEVCQKALLLLHDRSSLCVIAVLTLSPQWPEDQLCQQVGEETLVARKQTRNKPDSKCSKGLATSCMRWLTDISI